MSDPREHIADGVRAERAGSLDRALESFQAASRAAGADAAARSEALTRTADVYREQCNWEAGLAAAREAQSLARQAGLERQLADARIAEGNVLMIRGDFVAAMPIFEEVARSHAEPQLRGIALQNIGSMLAQRGQFGAAERAFQESLGNFQKAGYHRGEVIAWNNLGRLAVDRGDHARARPMLERAVVEAAAIEDAELGALASQNLATALAGTGEPDRAQDLAMSALGHFSGCRNHYREIECLRLIGDINARSGDAVSARRCYERALNLAETIESEVEARVTRQRLADLPSGP
jgi:tetratricopeptide (TPR) repeat protein